MPIEFMRCCELLAKMIEKYGDQVIPKIIIQEHEKEFSKICPEKGIQRFFVYVDEMKVQAQKVA